MPSQCLCNEWKQGTLQSRCKVYPTFSFFLNLMGTIFLQLTLFIILKKYLTVIESIAALGGCLMRSQILGAKDGFSIYFYTAQCRFATRGVAPCWASERRQV